MYLLQIGGLRGSDRIPHGIHFYLCDKEFVPLTFFVQ
jgi:hypothetical protein